MQAGLFLDFNRIAFFAFAAYRNSAAMKRPSAKNMPTYDIIYTYRNIIKKSYKGNLNNDDPPK